VDLDAFFVSVEQQLNPELRDKPVVVGGQPDRRGVVASASYEARQFGLHAGMPLITARRLCPQAIFIEGSFSRYRDASRKFMDILADFSPYLEPAGLDEAYLEATGFESLYGSISQMAAQLRQRVKDELGLNASVGIAGGKVVAKIASDLAKPDGMLEVPPGEERSFLAPLPVARLPGIGQKSGSRLNSLGIHTIGQMASLPLDTLKRRFGVASLAMHRHANGIDDRPIEPPGTAKSISRETTYARDTREQSQLEGTLRYLAERVGRDLRQQNKQAKCVTLKLRYADFTTITRRHTMKQPVSTNRAIFDTGRQLLQTALAQEKQPVRLIGIGVASLVESGRQLNMLDASIGRQERLDKAIDLIRKKYGFTSIQTGRTMRMKDLFPETGEGYTLHTPSLSR